MKTLFRLTILFLFSFAFGCVDPNKNAAFLSVSLQPTKQELLHGESLFLQAETKLPLNTLPIYFWYVDNVYQVGKTESSFIFSEKPQEASSFTVKVVVVQGIYRAEAFCSLFVKEAKAPIASFEESTSIFSPEENFTFNLNLKDPNNHPLSIQWFLNDQILPLPITQTKFSKSDLPSSFFPETINEYQLKAVVTNTYKTTECSIKFIITNEFCATFEHSSYSTIYGHPIPINLICNNPNKATFTWLFNKKPIQDPQPKLSWLCPAHSENKNQDLSYFLTVTISYENNKGLIVDYPPLKVPILITKQTQPSFKLFCEGKKVKPSDSLTFSFFDVINSSQIHFTTILTNEDNDPCSWQWKKNGSLIDGATQSEFVLDLGTLETTQSNYLFSVVLNDGFTDPVTLEFTLKIVKGPLSKILHLTPTQNPFQLSIPKSSHTQSATLLITNSTNDAINNNFSITLKSRGRAQQIKSEEKITTGAFFSNSNRLNNPKKAIDQFNQFAWQPPQITTSSKQEESRGLSLIGDEKNFYYCEYSFESGIPKPKEETLKTIPAQLIAIKTAQPFFSSQPNKRKKIEVWIEKDCLDLSKPKAAHMTKAKAEALAQFFLNEETPLKANDLYDWTTAIIGEEWSSKPISPLIANQNTIILFLYDIKGNRTTLPSPDETFTAGFFYSKDNYQKKALPYSNEAIMLYLDAVLFAAQSGESWDIEDPWPNLVISTAAHEFQHLINFYQKISFSNDITKREEVWLNEAASMLLEDLLADKLKTEGPRGVFYNDYTAGSTENRKGRIPLFLYNHAYTSLCNKQEESFSLNNYSQSYLFIAWLARNYGGANFLRALVQSPQTGMENVLSAIQTTSKKTFTEKELIQFWLSACWFSSIKDISGDYRFNASTPFSSSLPEYSSLVYRLGSINLSYYQNKKPFSGETINGIYSYNLSTLNEIPARIAPTSGFFVTLPNIDPNQSPKYEINLPDQCDITLLINEL